MICLERMNHTIITNLIKSKFNNFLEGSMENEQISITDLIIETHAGLERQGPGNSEMTIKALSFIDNLNEISRVADLGCGSGGQTMVLAQNINGSITGVDRIPAFINVFNNNAKKLNFQKRVNGVVGSMENLFFQREEFDLIWSEGAIDNIGFEKGINYWDSFLKNDGYIAVTCPSWFTDEHPTDVEEFWNDAGSGLDTIGHNISIMQKSGYSFVAAFTLPHECWTDNYFIPREAAIKAILSKYAGIKIAEDFAVNMRYETELFSKYKQYYGYVFYIGRKHKKYKSCITVI
jgi:SAM-dependent methyltransferase